MIALWDFLRTLSIRLLRWSLLSALVGSLLLVSGEPFWRGFGLQALAWGVVDAGIALWGFRTAARKERLLMTWEQVHQECGKLRRILWVNTFLDVIYIAGGGLLIGWQGGENIFMAGTGWGIVVQGAFLLFLDAFHLRQLKVEQGEV